MIRLAGRIARRRVRVKSHAAWIAASLPGCQAAGNDIKIQAIRSQWSDACDADELSAAQRDYFWGRQFLNDYAIQGYRA